MNTPLSTEDIERLARRRAGAKLGWYLHLTIYLVVNVGLFAMSKYGLGTRPWPVFPLLGWGPGGRAARHLGLRARRRQRGARTHGAEGARPPAARARRAAVAGRHPPCRSTGSPSCATCCRRWRSASRSRPRSSRCKPTGRMKCRWSIRSRSAPSSGRGSISANAFFFEEGSAQRFSAARYGEFRVDRASGEAVLVGLRDAALRPM